MRDFKRFVKGVILKPNDGGSNPIGNLSGVLTAADNGAVYQYQNRIKAFLDAAEREIITNDQEQTLTNKTIDADENPISNIDTTNLRAGVLVTDVSTASSNLEIPSALAVKNALLAQNEADEITFDPTADIPSNNVQDAIEDVQANLKAHLDSATAHDASEIVFNNTSAALPNNPATVQAAIQEVDARLDTVESSLGTETTKVANLITLSGVAANSTTLGEFTGTTIADNQTVKAAIQAVETAHETLSTNFSNHNSASTNVHGIGVGNSVVGTGTTQELTNKTLTAAILQGLTIVEDYISEESEDSSISGAAAVIASPTKPVVRLTNASLISVAGISALESATFGGVLTVVNATANDVEILNNAGVASEAILTGTDDDITLAPDAAILLKYDVVSDKFRIIGGTGSGSVIIKAVAGENLAAREAVYLSVGAADSRTAGQAYKLDASNDNRIEYVGLVKAAVTAGQTAKIITGGVVKGFTGLSVGVPVYLNTLTPGASTQVEPTTNQRWVIRLGIAISSTQVMILQDQGMTAFFNEEVQANITILNNQAVAQNVSNLVFDGAITNKFIVDYGLFRSTDSSSLAQAGRLRGVYNEDAAEWYISDDYSGQNAGVTFTITNGGQIQYTSSNLAGANYVGTLEYRISIGDGVHVLGVMEQNGDLITRIDGVNARLPIGAAGTALVSNGSLPGYGYPAQLSTASGSAPSYAARAWVNFNGTGTVAIRASGNVSSITDNNIGDYTVNFTTAMPDTSYSTCFGVNRGSANFMSVAQEYALNGVLSGKTTSSIRLLTHTVTLGPNFNTQDHESIQVAIFR